MMDLWLLLVTHLTVFLCGMGAGRFWVKHKIQVRDFEGHPALEYRSRSHNEENRF